MQNINPNNFVDKVLNSKNVVLVNYYSDDCDACKDIKTIIGNLKDDFSDKTDFYNFNISGELTYNTKNSRLALNQGIKKVPTVAIYKFGEKKEQFSEESLTKEKIQSALEKF